MLAAPAAAPSALAYTYLTLDAFDCGYDPTLNLMRPVVSLARFETDDGDLRASVGMQLIDLDDPETIIATLGTGPVSDGQLANGTGVIPIGGTESFVPELGAAQTGDTPNTFGDGAFGGPPLLVDHGYIIRMRIIDFGGDLSPDFLDQGCTTAAEQDSDGDDLSDVDETEIYGTNPDIADTDGDAISDGHEVLGYDADGDASIDVDLPSIGTDPLRADILVEIDWMESDHSDGPTSDAMSLVQDAFASAPWLNPDGSTGINLHIDHGPDSALLFGGTWASLSRGSAVGHTDVLGSWTGDYQWGSFNAIEQARFDAMRRPLFHYNLWAHDLANDPTGGHLLGKARGIPSSAFAVSLGSGTRSTFSDAGVFMHELGHTLGLQHGGFESVNGKPNYPSIMNYLYATLGVPVSGEAVLDYSPASLPSLDEASLDESLGVGGSYGARWLDQNGSPQADLAGGPIDWFFNHLTDAGVAVDVNGDGSTTTLLSHDDWQAITFDGGAIGDLTGSYVPPTSTPDDDEPTVEQQAALPPWPIVTATPTATDQSATTDVGVPIEISLEASDDDGDVLTFTIVDGPGDGSLDDCTDGTCTYTPDGAFSGTDSFTWKANDGTSDSNIATFSISVSTTVVTGVSNDAAGALALANAMVREPATLTGAAFVAVPSTGTPNGTATSLDGFAVHGPGFGILTSGDVRFADDPDDSGATTAALGSPPVRGDTDEDVTILRLDLSVPNGANCLRLDFSFYSEEYPEWVGSSYNDAFVAELDTSTWTTSGSTISAPDNFAFDTLGDVISINSTGATGMTATEADPTTYDGATVILRAATQVTPGAHSLYLSIFDQGDDRLDSAAFIDDIRLVTVADPATDCAEGAEVPTNTDPVAVADSATTPFETAIDIDVLDNDSDPEDDTLTVTDVTDPANGTTSINADGTVKYTPNAGFSGQDTFQYTISDGKGGTATATVTITVGAPPVNPPPTSHAGADKTGTEGSAISLDGTVTNTPAGDTLTTTWSYSLGAGTDAGMSCAFGTASAVDTTITCTDDGAVTVKLTVSDGVNPPVEDTATLTIANADPAVSITSPADAAGFQTGASVAVTASFTDPGANDSHTCSIDWGDGTTTTGAIAAGVCSGSHAYGAIGVPTVTVTVTDDDSGAGNDSIMVVISEPKTKVTGGGWLTYDNAKLRFGFVADGAGGGKGEIQVRWGKHKFHGKTVSGLVVNKPQATWTGTGRYDGTAGYTYQVTVIDNGNGGGKGKTPDRFAIVIRDPAGTIVFDTSGPLGGGNVKIH